MLLMTENTTCACLPEHLLKLFLLFLQESVQVVQPYLSSAKEAVLLRDALLMLTSSPGVDHYLQVSTEVIASAKHTLPVFKHTLLSIA